MSSLLEMNVLTAEQQPSIAILMSFGATDIERWSCERGCHWCVWGLTEAGILHVAVSASLRTPHDRTGHHRGMPIFSTYIADTSDLAAFLARCTVLGVGEDGVGELYARLYRRTPGATIYRA